MSKKSCLSNVRRLISEVKLSSLVPVSTKTDCVLRLLSRAYNLSQDTRKPVFGFPTRSDTFRAVWPKEMAKRLGFRQKRSFTIGVRCSAVWLCDFVFAYAKSRFSHDAAHINIYTQPCPRIMLRSLKAMK